MALPGPRMRMKTPIFIIMPGENEKALVKRQGNRILIFESILIYQHFHPEPVEGLHPLPLILSLSKDCTPYPSS